MKAAPASAERVFRPALGAGPPTWPDRFETSKWGLLVAQIDGEHVGGAAIARDTPDLEMLEGRPDLAVLWDTRVRPEHRRRGVGAALFEAAEAWAAGNGCRALKIETQSINVTACRFYAQRGCVLRAVRHGAYPQCSDEVRLLWGKDLAGTSQGGR